jgi:hypothetical protein
MHVQVSHDSAREAAKNIIREGNSVRASERETEQCTKKTTDDQTR